MPVQERVVDTIRGLIEFGVRHLGGLALDREPVRIPCDDLFEASDNRALEFATLEADE
jgi:hypothetical protein